MISLNGQAEGEGRGRDRCQLRLMDVKKDPCGQIDAKRQKGSPCEIFFQSIPPHGHILFYTASEAGSGKGLMDVTSGQRTHTLRAG
jgi:hypothetical protein